jgi:ABC-type dipeptide/oligopeptide/nickel transport system permease subunit
MVGFVIVTILIVTAIFAPWLAPQPYDQQDFTQAWQMPSWEHPMGTDGLGRDLFSRVIYGSQISLMVGFVVQLIVLGIGLPLGGMAGYYGGKIDHVVMRVVDVMSAFPQLLFIILITSVLGPGLFNIFLAIGVTGWVGICRLIRAQILSLKEKEFVEAARAMGARSGWILMKYLLPNALAPIIVSVTLGIPGAIFAEAGLSFLGIGIRPPFPSWGQMVGENAPYIRSYWHLSVFPAGMIALVMLGFTLVGDGLRDALDPRMRE